MGGSIASLLADFSPPSGSEGGGVGILRPVKAAENVTLEPQHPVVDHQAELLKAVESKARTEEREAAVRRLEEALASERTRHEEELTAQRKIWVEQQAAQLALQIIETMSRIETILCERVANIMRPFVSEAFRQKSITEFKEVLATLLYRGEARPMKIAGPKDVVTALQAELGTYEGAIEFLPGEHVEVSLTMQDTAVQTQLGPWATRLEQAFKAE